MFGLCFSVLFRRTLSQTFFFYLYVTAASLICFNKSLPRRFLKRPAHYSAMVRKGTRSGRLSNKGGHAWIRAKIILPDWISRRINGFARDRKGQSKPGKELARLFRRSYFKAATSAVDELFQSRQQLAAEVELDEIASASWDAIDKAPTIENYEHIKRLAVMLWVKRAVERGRPSWRP